MATRRSRHSFPLFDLEFVMANQSFGRFDSVGEFLESYKAAQEQEAAEAEKELPFEERARRRRERARAVVEVTAKLKNREPDDTDGDQHVRMLVTVGELVEGSTSVKHRRRACDRRGRGRLCRDPHRRQHGNHGRDRRPCVRRQTRLEGRMDSSRPRPVPRRAGNVRPAFHASSSGIHLRRTAGTML